MGRQKFEGVKAMGAVRLAVNPADTETVTIGNKVYEFDNNAAVTAGRVSVTIGGSAAATAANLITAINANKPTPGVTAYADPIDNLTVRLEADAVGSDGNMALAETMAGAGNEVSAANMTGGENAVNQVEARGEHVVTALDVAAGCIMISTGLSTPRFRQIDCWSSTGLQKALTSLCTFDGSRIKIDFDGATNPVAGDLVSWAAWE
jgi:hypothetical protein